MGNIILSLKNIEARNSIRYSDIDVEKCQTVFIVGESGVGKSSLLEICNGMLNPSDGNVFFHDKDIYTLDPLYVRRNIMLLGQNVFLFDGSIFENFKTFYTYREQSVPSKDDIAFFLDTCNLSKKLDYCCSNLSGGERQRLHIAITLSFMPEILMLDEPTSSLDSKNASRVIQNIVEFAKKNSMSLMIVSHAQEILHYADKKIYLESGTIL